MPHCLACAAPAPAPAEFLNPPQVNNQSTMNTLSIFDLAFFATESEQSPKHVAGLITLRKPDGAPVDYVEQLAAEIRSHNKPTPPYNQVIDFVGGGLPRWREAEHFDIADHVLLHQPEQPLDMAALTRFAANLHGPMLSRDRPLWEFHFIDNVDRGRFAIYAKTHHSYADGVTLTAWMNRSLAVRPGTGNWVPVWALDHSKQRRESDRVQQNLLQKLLLGSRKQFINVLGFAKLGAQLWLERFGLTRNAVAVPFRATGETPLTGSVSSARQLAVAAVDMERVQTIRSLTRSTLNHVALTCIDGALHHYLEDLGVQLEQPITIQMPVSLRREGDEKAGNQIGIVLVDLAQRTTDPYVRLREIGFTLRNVRSQVDGVPPGSVMHYTLALGVFAQLAEFLRLTDVLPPVGNTLVSNVPGPKKPLFLGDAEVETIVPISTLTPGNRLNITLYSYAGTLYFGLVGTEELGDLQSLAGHIERAFVELEQAVQTPASGGR